MARLIGNTIVENFDFATGQAFNAQISEALPNGTVITDAMVDNGIIFKVPVDLDPQGGGNRFAVRTDFLQFGTISAAFYGSAPGKPWEVNRDAIQKANDFAEMIGGGIVDIPAGDLYLKGVKQGSFVTFRASGQTKFTHPDGASGHIIEAKEYATTGSIANTGYEVTVASTANIKEGTVLAIRGAGGRSDRQSTKIIAAITASETTIPVADNARFGTTEFGIIGNEIIGWTNKSGPNLTGVQRGMFGTTPAAHAIDAPLFQAMRLYTEVRKINGNVLTVSVPAKIGVTNAQIDFGIVSPKILNINFDGKRILPLGSANNPLPVQWNYVRWGEIHGGIYENGDLGAIMLGRGASDCTIAPQIMRDSGISSGDKGSVLWMFRGCKRNKVINPKIYGECYHGIYIDDRTQTASEFDGPCDNNEVINPDIDIMRSGNNVAMMVVGGSYNTFRGGQTRGTRTSVAMDANQTFTHDGSKPATIGNHVDSVVMKNHYYPYVLSVPGNLIENCATENISNPGYDTGGNTIRNNGGMFSAIRNDFGYKFLLKNATVEPKSDLGQSVVYVPFAVPYDMRLTEIGLEVTAVTGGLDNIRCGIYSVMPDGRPDRLIWDTSITIALNEVGVRYMTIARTVYAGEYYLGIGLRGLNTGNKPTLITAVKGDQKYPSGTRPASAQESFLGYKQEGSGTSGSMPSIAGNSSKSLVQVGEVPHVYLKWENTI